ncbi:MAG: Hsp20/alpha crystallin family protein, partial [Caldimonas sp.]
LDVPGITREQLKVTIEGRRLSIETVAPADAEAAATDSSKNEVRVLYRERGAAQYARTVSLPAEVDSAASQAKVENGVLTLTLAKKVATGALAISVS